MLLDETTASSNICYCSMADLGKQYASTNTFIVEETAEMYQTGHSTVVAYHRAMRFIRD